MKILMATHYFASHLGGLELVAEHLARELSLINEEVVWVATDATPAPLMEGNGRAVAVHAVNAIERTIGLPYPIPTPGAVARIDRELNGKDVLVIHDCLYLSNVVAFLLARRRGIPIIVIQHISVVPYRNPVLRGLMATANRILTNRLLSRADQVVFISELTAAYFADLPFRRRPCVIYNGVDTATFRPLRNDEDRWEIRHRLGLPVDRPVMLFVGRFVEKKGLHALHRMAADAPEFIWAFAGAGPLDPQRWQLPNVRVFAGLPRPSLAELYRACDCVVLPSTGEGFPLVVQEAIASGLPVVCAEDTATADSAAARFIDSAPVVATDSAMTARGFLAAVRTALKSRPITSAQAMERWQFACDRYSWKAAAGTYQQIALGLAGQG
jgi:glycosyltransferase involved in cell wall biosynthesis